MFTLVEIFRNKASVPDQDSAACSSWTKKETKKRTIRLSCCTSHQTYYFNCDL